MKKNTGMIRALDMLGRIVIPAEIRMTRNIEIGDPVEFFIGEDNVIVIRKYKSTECTFCRGLDSVIYYKDQFVCQSCLTDLKPASNSHKEVTPPPQEMPQSTRKNTKAPEMKRRLQQAVQDYPDANQKELARLLGVSASRISQLKKELNTSE
ncbi:AbrB/MazE/SpoVT family DNA-binding domain-containing protein [Paenibacillus apiarius]|uniref:AbrB/MazE/SpoVT family DNA-binding domain-containing protein n=1 Tax=Paenibacillus apiarius TaxID=46240 RepID=A0ABT4DZC2_9BACL|nr:AbrB/MazE/SpoVT family DNA-binding domain-containing protein [Paenibacillus apiarius]MBN3526592.1 AbrB/MazE/SpoVT family DNA-binding domain-containing protein [Paenibacillus apiarius]MCY9517719.1 AbrB/MazE/SpoVT family DNA-binding domain-containing protein [Paenibacillus apiarius]MCY9521628.1 AbrB/MazE/SpoVT family DNA-binding domain-containing protein [Paenibacillus apiarius]MCY9555306.1 AbrB/MazE/SpoVT family DNA-binding domain-containing protein [Paenibacillus apiarius]MCY9561186.1 AbrB/